MARVETVRGPVDTAELGQTLMHEHVFVLTPEVQANLPQPWDEDGQVADAVTKLQALVDIGVRTIVDPTVIGLGRDIGRIQRVNERVDLNIIVATGIYTYDSVPFYFQNRFALDGGTDPMVDLFVHDITEGIVSTGVKAGMLKCAVDEPGLTPGVERILRAVATAHRLTGTPITVHTHPADRGGLEVARVLAEEGVDPRQGRPGPQRRQPGPRAPRGAGRDGLRPRHGPLRPRLAITAEQRAQVVIELCRRGWSKSLVLSHDASCHIDWLDDSIRTLFMPDWHYTHIHRGRAAGAAGGRRHRGPDR